MAYENCTEVTPECPVSGTIYGYRPNLAGNSIFLAVFAILSIAQIVIGTWKRLWIYATVVSIAMLLEMAGYIGRVMMHHNPWSDAGFKLQIVCLILAPAFLAAGVYLVLKHTVIALGPEHSRLKPQWYPRIFIFCDFFSIVIQGVGGGVATSNDSSTSKIGSDLIIAGICIQVATMGVCLLLALDFAWSLRKTRPITYNVACGRRAFQGFLVCFSFAFLTIFIRCIYRIPEMAGGWGNSLMQNEKEFLILDGAMIAIAGILMTVAHPGFFFREMDVFTDKRQRRAVNDYPSAAGSGSGAEAYDSSEKLGAVHPSNLS